MHNALRKLLILFITYSFASGVVAQVPEKESVLKAAFIYNFTKYIEWSSDSRVEFTIAVIGNSPVFQSLTDMAVTKTAGGKKINVIRYENPDEIEDCNILFISSDNPYSISSILQHTHQGTLTISESPGYARKGTCINFVIKDDKLKFEANVKSIFDAGLKASSQLLKLAILEG